MNHLFALLLIMTMFWLASSRAAAQSSSLFGPPGQRRALTISQDSWYYVDISPPRELRINDIITVVVDEKSQVISEGEMDKRKNAQLNAILSDWIRFEHGNLKPDKQEDGDPAVSASLNSRYRAEAEMETRDGMKFRIAARIVDIRPNGNMVLEAHRTIRNNKDVWMQSLTGIIRREDVLPDNTVLSEDIAELSIRKRELGSVRDGYRRGWLTRWYDALNPF